jgi:hypothetical protein
MAKYNLTNAISKCKAYEANGLAEHLKAEVRGIRRNLEYRFEKEKQDQRQNYEEARWN